MEPERWLLFTTVALVSMLSPGPAVLLAVRNSLSLGLRYTVFSSLGNITGVFIVAAAATLGLGALLHTSELGFTLVKLFGAAYLIFLGLRHWGVRREIFLSVGMEAHRVVRSALRLFTEGLLLALGNPKAILFFTALFPQFIDRTRPVLPQFVILIATFMFFSFWMLMAFGFVAQRLGLWFGVPGRARLFNLAIGALFVALGLGLLRLE